MTDNAEQKLKAVEREIKMRRRVYPRFVESGRMSQDKADAELSIMEAIAEDYRGVVERTRLL